MNILVADDDRESRISIGKMLQKLGNDVLLAIDGDEAWQHYQNNDVDIVILDWMLPIMDGIQLSKRIRELDSESAKHCFILMGSSKHEKQDIMKALEAGVDDFISKPYDLELLESRLTIAGRCITARENIEAQNAPGSLDVVDTLLQEHKVMMRIAGIFEVVSHGIEEEQLPPKILEWCRSAAFLLISKLHHTKEYRYMDVFVERALNELGSQNSVFDHSSFTKIEEEHKRMEKLLFEFKKEIREYAIEKKGAAEKLMQTIDSYVLLLRSHVAREENVFFPFSKLYLAEKDMQQLPIEFDRI